MKVTRGNFVTLRASLRKGQDFLVLARPVIESPRCLVAIPMTTGQGANVLNNGTGLYASARFFHVSQPIVARAPISTSGRGGNELGFPKVSRSRISGLSRPQALSAIIMPLIVPFVTPMPF